MAQRESAFLDRAAARGDAFIGTERGARGLQANTRDVDIEFFRGHLHHRGKDALTDFDFAGVQRHCAVGIDG